MRKWFIIYLIINISAFVCSSSADVHYDQCDSRWADELIGSTQHTICKDGDILTSLAMTLASLNTTTNWIRSTSTVITPSSLNTWLNNSEGYLADSTIIDMTTIGNLTRRLVYNTHLSPSSFPSFNQLQDSLNSTSYLAQIDDRSSHYTYIIGVVPNDDNTKLNEIIVFDPSAVSNKPRILPYLNVSGLIAFDNHKKNIPRQYPTYKQCDPKWGSNLMVTTTVCKV